MEFPPTRSRATCIKHAVPSLERYYRVVYNGFTVPGELISAAWARRDSADSWHAEAYVEVGQGKWSEDSIHFPTECEEYINMIRQTACWLEIRVPRSHQLTLPLHGGFRVGARTAFRGGRV